MHSLTISKIHEFVTKQKGWQYSKLREDYHSLRAGYRAQNLQGYHNNQHIQAYVFSRLPATYAVACKLITHHLKHLPIQSVIDWGCGVGAASLALADVMAEPIDYHLIESNDFALEYAHEFMHLMHGIKHKIHKIMPDQDVDLAIMSYSLNELGNNWQETINMLWAKSKYLLIIEPGTHNIFQSLAKVRDFLINQGAKIIAPCFHQKQCPLANTDDWCHFNERITRTKEMKFLKQADRGFEDEAYSYLLLSKADILENNMNIGRVVANPMQHGGHVKLKLCSADGAIENITVSKKHAHYKNTKKLKWGDSYVQCP